MSKVYDGQSLFDRLVELEMLRAGYSPAQDQSIGLIEHFQNKVAQELFKRELEHLYMKVIAGPGEKK